PKAITNKRTRVLVFLSAAAGLLYNALWYIPLLMLAAGIISVIYDFRWLHEPFRKVDTDMKAAPSTTDAVRQRTSISAHGLETVAPASTADDNSNTSKTGEHVVPETRCLGSMTWHFGLVRIIVFPIAFVVGLVLRGVLRPAPPVLYRLFSNMYLAGTIIFGGGPVVTPPLREYVVADGSVSPRDFFIGHALVQGFPGPNSGFAVVSDSQRRLISTWPTRLSGDTGRGVSTPRAFTPA
ncbi:hypothetical protein GE09DRAFT_966299, partial [Coniochaeta sp. 2T2.1]